MRNGNSSLGKGRTPGEALILRNGAVYTPETLSDYIAEKTLFYALSDASFNRQHEISIVDPAVGEGMLLGSLSKQALDRDKRMDLRLCGIDIDPKALASCKKRFQGYRGRRIKLKLIATNSLRPFGRQTLSGGLRELMRKASAPEGFDLLVANPPWGADLTQIKSKLDPKEFRTLQGQFDSFELFFELALKIVRVGGYICFIIPDSILNHGKSTLRELLVNSTQIRFLARLGEGIFPNVSRGTVVLICKNSPPNPNTQTDCFRLTSFERSKILKGHETFTGAERSLIHRVPQTRFVQNPHQQFDIDLRETESSLLRKIRGGSVTLRNYLTSTRGVELGISGRIFQCSFCKKWAPMSDQKALSCRWCGSKIRPETAVQDQIVVGGDVPHSLPLITGRDLKRYVCTPSRRIVLGKDGIDYKERAAYTPPKILVRKTGVGLTAALDYTESYTNQVVYIFHRLRESDPSLEFFIALVNSRVYYFVLSKSFGELEWRSHPYLTQSQILGLPVPSLESARVREVSEKIRRVLVPALSKGKPTMEDDIEIERLIGELFSLDRKDFKLIFDAIDEAEELLPVKELKNFGVRELYG